MTAAGNQSFAQFGLVTFPEALVQMVRAGASRAQIRDEGFSASDIDAVSQLVLLADSTEHLDGGERAARDTQEPARQVDEMTPVTASPS